MYDAGLIWFSERQEAQLKQGLADRIAP